MSRRGAAKSSSPQSPWACAGTSGGCTLHFRYCTILMEVRHERHALPAMGISLLMVALILYLVDRTIAESVVQKSQHSVTPLDCLILILFQDIGVSAIVLVLVSLRGFYLVVGDLLTSFFSTGIATSFYQIKSSIDDGFSSISGVLHRSFVNLEKDLIYPGSKMKTAARMIINISGNAR